MAYSSEADVAAVTPMHTDATTKLFTTTTRPTLAQVTDFLDEISGIVDLVLASFGFTTPVTETTAKKAIDMFVRVEVGGLVEGVNGSGRFGPTAKSPGGRGTILYNDILAFVEAVASGFELLGVPRPRGVTFGIGFREFDNAGNAIFPIFTRSDYGNVFVNQEPE